MACKTLMRIAEICGNEFVEKQIKTETKPFPLIVEILNSLPKILENLRPQQRSMIYTAIGII